MSNLSPLAITLHQCHAVGGWERVAAEVEGMVATWRPISEAPRDGTLVWTYTAAADGLPAFQGLCAYHEDAGWCTDELREVTHWMPLPPPPVDREARV